MELSKKLEKRARSLHFVGSFSPNEGEGKGMKLVLGKEEGLLLSWLVDESDGVIADAKFRAFGPMALLLAADIASELVLRKTYAQASRLSADLIDRHGRDAKQIEAFPSQAFVFLNKVLSAIDSAASQCTGIPLKESYETTPIEASLEVLEGGIPDWERFSIQEKISLIETVIDKEIRPYVELDEGGVEIVSLSEQGELVIAYQGACTSCYSAQGSTLSAIQNILQARIHPTLIVIPQL